MPRFAHRVRDIVTAQFALQFGNSGVETVFDLIADLSVDPEPHIVNDLKLRLVGPAEIGGSGDFRTPVFVDIEGEIGEHLDAASKFFRSSLSAFATSPEKPA